MCVVFVRRIARPISPWRIHLKRNQFVRGKPRWYHRYNLPRCIFATTQTGTHLGRRNQCRVKLRLRGYAALGNLALGLGAQRRVASVWQIECIREPVEDTCPAPDPPFSYAPIRDTDSI